MVYFQSRYSCATERTASLLRSHINCRILRNIFPLLLCSLSLKGNSGMKNSTEFVIERFPYFFSHTISNSPNNFLFHCSAPYVTNWVVILFFFSKFSCHVFAQLSLFIDEFCAHFLRSSILSFISNSFSRIVQISNFSPQFMKIRYFSEFSTIFIHFRIYSDVLWDVTNENNIINKHFVSVNESLRTNSQDSLQLRKISSKKSQFSLERLEQFRTKAIPWP